MKFATQFDKRSFPASCAGSRVKCTFAGHYDEKGRVVLEEVGKINLYDEIQSHAQSVDIHTLLKRFANGDPTALASRQGIFADVTEMPKTYAEFLNKMISLENGFNSLPADVKQKFGNSFQQFLAESDAIGFAEKLGLVTSDPVESVKEEATE